MTDNEFDLLDELYFVQSFSDLKEILEWEEGMVKETLHALIDKGWVKCFKDIKAEVALEDVDFQQLYSRYFYLATKAGLLAHNGR